MVEGGPSPLAPVDRPAGHELAGRGDVAVAMGGVGVGLFDEFSAVGAGGKRGGGGVHCGRADLGSARENEVLVEQACGGEDFAVAAGSRSDQRRSRGAQFVEGQRPDSGVAVSGRADTAQPRFRLQEMTFGGEVVVDPDTCPHAVSTVFAECFVLAPLQPRAFHAQLAGGGLLGGVRPAVRRFLA